jgi:hypothetical protein
MDEIEGFDWDAANVGHILRHAVTPAEAEEVVIRPPCDGTRHDNQGRTAVEAFGEDRIPPLLGRGVHDSP